MELKQNNAECLITCWGIAAFVGFLAMVMLYGFSDFMALQAIFTGGLTGTILGGTLSVTVCTSQTAAQDLASENTPAARYAAAAAERKARAASALVPAGSAGVVGYSAGTSATGAADPASQGQSRVGGPVAGTIDAGEQDTSAPDGTVAAVNTIPPSALKNPTAEIYAAAPVAEGAGATKLQTTDDRPDILLGAARPEGKDDLKRISGVGPKLEETLNDLGIYHFDQIARFSDRDIAWVDERLRFKGRIVRDDWMAQAKALAEGSKT